MMAGSDPQRLEHVWAPCGYCWGQGRVHDVVSLAGGEGDVLAPMLCPSCLGVGQLPVEPIRAPIEVSSPAGS